MLRVHVTVNYTIEVEEEQVRFAMLFWHPLRPKDLVNCFPIPSFAVYDNSSVA